MHETTNNKTNNKVGSIEALLSLPDCSFDVITLWHVLEHVPNLEDHFKLFKRLLKPDGHLIIAVPNYNSYDAKFYKSFWAAYDVPRHLWHFSKTSFVKFSESYHFNLLEILPMKFDSFYVSLLSEKYKNGKMNAFSAFITGLKSNLRAKKNKEYSSLIYILRNKQIH